MQSEQKPIYFQWYALFLKDDPCYDNACIIQIEIIISTTTYPLEKKECELYILPLNNLLVY